MRKEIFADGEYYHIFNRGVDKRKIFLHNGHYIRFLKTIHNLLASGKVHQKTEYDQSLAFSTKLSFLGYCLMPNHHHFLVRQKEEGGISHFMHQLNTSYTKYFNLNHKRTGRLFEYTFKAVHIESEEQLLHVSRYIHLNPLISNVVTDLRLYPWSSYLDYIGVRGGKLCQKEEILGLLSKGKPEKRYEEFVLNQVDYARILKDVKNLLFE